MSWGEKVHFAVMSACLGFVLLIGYAFVTLERGTLVTHAEMESGEPTKVEIRR